MGRNVCIDDSSTPIVCAYYCVIFEAEASKLRSVRPNKRIRIRYSRTENSIEVSSNDMTLAKRSEPNRSRRRTAGRPLLDCWRWAELHVAMSKDASTLLVISEDFLKALTTSCVVS